MEPPNGEQMDDSPAGSRPTTPETVGQKISKKSETPKMSEKRVTVSEIPIETIILKRLNHTLYFQANDV